MEIFYWLFPVSGVKTYIFIPPLVALIVSFFTSMGGVSGAFLLLPFQVSFLGFTSPSVSATNFVFNIVAIPSGVYRYLKEGRMAWPLTWVVIVGTLPGVFIGYYLRVLYLPDPRAFKLFVGCVLLYIGIRLLYEMSGRSQKGKKEMKALEAKFNQRTRELKEGRNARMASGLPAEAVVKTIHFSLTRVEYEFWGERFSYQHRSHVSIGLRGRDYRRDLWHRRGGDNRSFLRGRVPVTRLYRGGGGLVRDLHHLHCRGLFL